MSSAERREDARLGKRTGWASDAQAPSFYPLGGAGPIPRSHQGQTPLAILPGAPTQGSDKPCIQALAKHWTCSKKRKDTTVPGRVSRCHGE